MRPFAEGGGYWLCVPKPWNRRKFVDPVRSGISVEKRLRLEGIVEGLQSMKRKHKRGRRPVCYREGQSLFILPKVLSNGICQWKHYEVRLKNWMRNYSANRTRGGSKSKNTSAVSESGSHSFHDVSMLSQSFEKDPLRAFYTLWHLHTNKAPKNRLLSSEKVLDYIESVWNSPTVDCSISKTPKGGVSGRIEDPSTLTAKGVDTLQRWSRVVSHFEAGYESGEDEDPVEIWNRAVETSMLHHSLNSSGSTNETPRDSRKRKYQENVPPERAQKSPSASTAAVETTIPTRSGARRQEDSPKAKRSPPKISLEPHRAVKSDSAPTQVASTSALPVYLNDDQCASTSSRLDEQSMSSPVYGISSAGRRRSNRILVTNPMDVASLDTKKTDVVENVEKPTTSTAEEFNSTPSGVLRASNGRRSTLNEKIFEGGSPTIVASSTPKPILRRTPGSAGDLRLAAWMNSASKSGRASSRLSDSSKENAGVAATLNFENGTGKAVNTGERSVEEKPTTVKTPEQSVEEKPSPRTTRSVTKREERTPLRTLRSTPSRSKTSTQTQVKPSTSGATPLAEKTHRRPTGISQSKGRTSSSRKATTSSRRK